MPIPEIPRVPPVPKVPSVPGVPKLPVNSSTETEDPTFVPIAEASAFGALNSTDLKKIGKGALIAFIGAGIPATVEYLSGIDFGPWRYPVMAAVSIFANTVLKLLNGK